MCLYCWLSPKNMLTHPPSSFSYTWFSPIFSCFMPVYVYVFSFFVFMFGDV